MTYSSQASDEQFERLENGERKAIGSAEGMFAERLFATTEEDLRWALAYTFYLVMQTSAMYNRLRTPMPMKEAVHISALAFLNLLPKSFTTEEAVKIGEEQGIKARAVRYQLSTLYTKGYIERRQRGVYLKAKRKCVQKLQHNLPLALTTAYRTDIGKFRKDNTCLNSCLSFCLIRLFLVHLQTLNRNIQ